MARINSLSIIVPALNEEPNVADAVNSIVDALDQAQTDWEIILVDDGSNDATGSIADAIAAVNSRIRVIHHAKPMGIGYCFREGASCATKEAVTFLPGDGENDPVEIIKHLPLLEHVDMVVPYVVNKDARSKARQALSGLYLRIINVSFSANFKYANGNVLYNRRIFDAVKSKSNSFFFTTEYLMRATRAGFTFSQVPILIRKRLQGESKALTIASLRTLSKEYMRLFWALRIVDPMKKLFRG
jgi:dolichol-phosphate mannosyltransferase